MMQSALTVVKLGGAALENSSQRSDALDQVASLQGARILVHGGGSAASTVAERLGIQPRMIDGRRITDSAMLEVVTMVYGGLVSRTLVAELQTRGCNACGCTGADFNLIRSHKREVTDIDYGFVGDIDLVNAPALTTLLDQGVLPVLAPLTHDGAGSLLNTNADTIASAVASAMTASMSVTLLYCFDRGGVFGAEGEMLPWINPENARELEEQNVITTGMLPKLQNAFTALRAGVARVVLCSVSDITEVAAGRLGRGTEVRL